MTARRRFFGKITALASLISEPFFVSGCDSNTEKQIDSLVLDAGQGRQLLDAFVDSIVPKDRDPGAVEAGVPEKLLAYFARKPEAAEKAQQMLKIIDVLAVREYKTSFNELSIKQREERLRFLTHSADKNHMTARVELLRLRSRVIEGFYSSPAGRQMLGYTLPYPGGYPDFNKPPPA